MSTFEERLIKEFSKSKAQQIQYKGIQRFCNNELWLSTFHRSSGSLEDNTKTSSFSYKYPEKDLYCRVDAFNGCKYFKDVNNVTEEEFVLFLIDNSFIEEWIRDD